MILRNQRICPLEYLGGKETKSNILWKKKTFKVTAKEKGISVQCIIITIIDRLFNHIEAELLGKNTNKEKTILYILAV